MKLKFIPESEDDRTFFIHVHHTAYRSTIEKMFEWDEALQDNYANTAFDGGGINIIWRDNQKVGVVGWEHYLDFILFKELFILPDFQGQGIGSYTLKFTINLAQQLNNKLRLQTLKENLGAKALYERHGLSVIEETDIHWKLVLTTA